MNSPHSISARFALAEQIALLQRMQEEIDYKAQALSNQELQQAALNTMSVYARNIKHIKGTTNAVIQIGEQTDEFHQSVKNEEIAHGFHFAALALSTLNFFRIPFMYLTAYLLKQQVPFNLSNNLRWAYSGMLLTLTLTAFALPVTAPVIGFVLASIGVVASTFFLAKLFYQRSKLTQEDRALQRQINHIENSMASIQAEANLLESQLNKAGEEHEVIAVIQEISLLHECYQSDKKSLETLYDQRMKQQQLIAQLSFNKVLLRGMSLFLACASVVGLVLALFFPPVGLGILAAVALTSASMILARVFTPIVHAMAGWLTQKLSAAPHYEPLKQEPNNEQENTLTSSREEEAPLVDERRQSSSHDSTTDVLLSLMKCAAKQPSAEIRLKEEPAPASSLPASTMEKTPDGEDSEEEHRTSIHPNTLQKS